MTAPAVLLAATLSLAALAPAHASALRGAPPQFELVRTTLAAAEFGEARLRGTGDRVTIRGAALPAGDGAFRWALYYAYQRYEYTALPSRNRDLHRLELPLSWYGDAPSPWMLELRPVIASSSNVFKEIWSRGSSDDYMWHGRATLEHPPRGMGWGWRLGAARDDAFGRELIYPEFALLRQHGGGRMEFGWPVTRAMLEAGGGIEAGGEIAPAGARWHVVSDERGGASFDYRTRAWRAGATLSWRSAAGFVIAARGGLEFERRHRLEDDTGTMVDRAVGEAGYFELVAAYQW